MAKSRAQRKAEQRKRAAQKAAGGGAAADAESKAQHDTQVPSSPDVTEAELAERGANLDELKSEPDSSAAVEAEAPAAPAPSRGETAPTEDKITRRERKRLEREERDRVKASEERRKPRSEPVERQRGRIMSFFISWWHELKRVQWPDRDTLIQASAVTLIFIAVAAADLGVLDAIFSEVVQLIL